MRKEDPFARAVVVTDISERKRAEELLAKERAFLRQVIDTTPDIIVVKDRDGRYVLGNEAAARFFGSTVQDMVGKTDYDLLLNHDPATDALVHAEQTAHNETDLRVIQSQQQILAPDFPVTDANGQTHWFTANKTPLIESDGTCNRMLIAATDITERKRTDEALRQSEAKYRTLVETSPDTVVLADLRGNLTFVSHGILELHGSESLEEFIGKQTVDFIVQEDHQRFLANFNRTLEEGVTRDIEYTFIRKDGTRFPGEVSGAVILDRAGKPESLMALVKDISERKRAQEALEREHRTLRLLLQSSDHERQVIAYEIHDGLAQQLAAAIMQFDAFDHLKETKPKQAADAYHAAMTMLRQGHFEARRLIAGVRPPILDDEGIVAAVGHLVNEERRKKGPKIEYLSKVEFERLNPLLENAMYRIVQEALTNACRYSMSKKGASRTGTAR